MKWSIKVEKVAKGTYRTMFSVGVQSFELAYSDDPEESKHHCEHIAKMFLVALGNLGVKVNVKNPHLGSTLKSLFVELGEWDEVKAGAKKKIAAERNRRKKASKSV